MLALRSAALPIIKVIVHVFHKRIHVFIESSGRVVTRWPGSKEVGGSIPSCSTKFVRCKNQAFNIGECVSRGSDTTYSCWSHVYWESHPRACKRPQGACR